MDVLEHYTTYDSRQILKATVNPEFDKDQSEKKLRVWVESQPRNQKESSNNGRAFS